MTTSKFATGTSVKNAKGQQGTIINVITKSTGYVLVEWEGGKQTKEMAFNLTDMEGNALKAKPAKRAPKADTRTPQQKLAQELVQYANTDRWNENSFFNIALQALADFCQKVMELDCFAAKVAETVDKSIKPFGNHVATISEKQAWILACAAVENGIEL